MTAQKTVAVIGGSGFVGRHLLARLVNAGHRVPRWPEARPPNPG